MDAITTFRKSFLNVRNEELRCGPEFRKGPERIWLEDGQGRVAAEVTFPETSPGVFTINHTYVDTSLRGQGIASELVQAAVDEIQAQGGEVRATCSYAVKWLSERGMEY
ncbi:MAG: N-acetyltransferase [Parasporobacterium sp.]|nr:N-acetyltransferase [Parasporobacterium sp.]